MLGSPLRRTRREVPRPRSPPPLRKWRFARSPSRERQSPPAAQGPGTTTVGFSLDAACLLSLNLREAAMFGAVTTATCGLVCAMPRSEAPPRADEQTRLVQRIFATDPETDSSRRHGGGFCRRAAPPVLGAKC